MAMRGCMSEGGGIAGHVWGGGGGSVILTIILTGRVCGKERVTDGVS